MTSAGLFSLSLGREIRSPGIRRLAPQSSDAKRLEPGAVARSGQKSALSGPRARPFERPQETDCSRSVAAPQRARSANCGRSALSSKAVAHRQWPWVQTSIIRGLALSRQLLPAVSPLPAISMPSLGPGIDRPRESVKRRSWFRGRQSMEFLPGTNELCAMLAIIAVTPFRSRYRGAYRRQRS